MKHGCETHESHESTAIWRYEYKCYARVDFYKIAIKYKQFVINLSLII